MRSDLRQDLKLPEGQVGIATFPDRVVDRADRVGLGRAEGADLDRFGSGGRFGLDANPLGVGISLGNLSRLELRLALDA